MYARVATYEDASPDGVRAATEAIKEQGGPPPGVDSHSITVFHDAVSGKVIVAGLFETREALDRGHAVLSAMDPPAGGFGRQVSVDLMEVPLSMSLG
jgi:hypothetical protein